MARPRTYKTEAIVLKQTPFAEADRILTLYTPDLGKVRAIAKGVRRTKSRLGGHLELLNRVSVSVAHGRNLDVVNEAQALQTFRALSDNLSALSKAIYLADLVNEFSAEQSPNLSVYELLVEALGCLASDSIGDLLLRYFEMTLLQHSGYRPELHHCVECQATLEPGDHYFSCNLGGALCQNCRNAASESLVPISINAMKVLRYLQRQSRIDEIAGLNVSPRILGDVERVLRSYVRHVIERDLKSADFMHLVSAG